MEEFDHRPTDYVARIVGRAGSPHNEGLLPSAVSEQRGPTWIVDAIVNRAVRMRRRARMEAASAEAATRAEVGSPEELYPG